MSQPEDDGPGEKPEIHKDGVAHDSRGGAVWKWAADSGRHLMESTSQLLKRLDVPGLKLEDDASDANKKPGATPGAPKRTERNVGYDPYGGKRAGPPAGTRPVTASRPVRKPAAAPQPRRSWWQRWFGRD